MVTSAWGDFVLHKWSNPSRQPCGLFPKQDDAPSAPVCLALTSASELSGITGSFLYIVNTDAKCAWQGPKEKHKHFGVWTQMHRHGDPFFHPSFCTHSRLYHDEYESGALEERLVLNFNIMLPHVTTWPVVKCWNRAKEKVHLMCWCCYETSIKTNKPL